MLPTYLRIVSFLAHINRELGYYSHAQNLCNEVIHIIRIFIDMPEPKEYYLEAVRVAEVAAEMMCTVKEFESAFKLVDNIAEKAAKKVIDYFGVEVKDIHADI